MNIQLKNFHDTSPAPGVRMVFLNRKADVKRGSLADLTRYADVSIVDLDDGLHD